MRFAVDQYTCRFIQLLIYRYTHFIHWTKIYISSIWNVWIFMTVKAHQREFLLGSRFQFRPNITLVVESDVMHIPFFLLHPRSHARNESLKDLKITNIPLSSMPWPNTALLLGEYHQNENIFGKVSDENTNYYLSIKEFFFYI